MTKTTPLTRDDWCRAALELLRRQGIGGVRVLTLAKELGVSRGSFYWHFRDRQDLLDRMLEFWDRELTEVVIRHVEAIPGPPARRIRALAEFVVEADQTRHDHAVRSWAFGDERALPVVRKVMRKRINFVVAQFRAAGFSPAEATTRGDLLAVYLMGQAVIHIDETLEERLRLVRRQVRTLTKKR